MSKRVYLDNAATTPLAPEVFDVMAPMLKDVFGNPSSTHSFGRAVKGKIEQARRTVAKLLNVTPGEIVFTSGGTEADNMAIVGAVRDCGVKRIISSPIEHHAVLHTIEEVERLNGVKVDHVKLTVNGEVDLNHLEELLKQSDEKTLVSLMHANNEIGNLLPLREVGEMCRKYDAFFHSDTVQTMGHYRFDLQELPIDFATCAAHKFHGPKGVGFLYIRNEVKIKPFIQGGAQERSMRGGTENVYGIIGLAKALELSHENADEHEKHIEGLKDHMMSRLDAELEGVRYNGICCDHERSLHTVLNVTLPKTDKAELLLFNMDLMGVAVSGGSACTSGSNTGSHVLRGIDVSMERPSVRFSFSRYNTKEEVDYAIDCLLKIYQKEKV
jgi:cysteine desulfurase